MNIQKILLERIISPIITWFIINLLSLIYTQIETGSWINLFSLINPVYYTIFTFFILTWILIIILFKKNKSSSGYIGAVVGGSRHGYENIGDYPYFDVIWKLRIPKKHPLEQLSAFNEPSIRDIDIDSSPRCPECGTKLEINNGPIWNTWSCAECNFKKRTIDDIHKVYGRVKNRVDREIEISEENEFKKI